MKSDNMDKEQNKKAKTTRDIIEPKPQSHCLLCIAEFLGCKHKVDLFMLVPVTHEHLSYCIFYFSHNATKGSLQWVARMSLIQTLDRLSFNILVA